MAMETDFYVVRLAWPREFVKSNHNERLWQDYVYCVALNGFHNFSCLAAMGSEEIDQGSPPT